MRSPATATKEKKNKCDYTKLKILFRAKETNKNENQPTEWEKIFAKDISDKELIFKIYKELITIQYKNFKERIQFKINSLLIRNHKP